MGTGITRGEIPKVHRKYESRMQKAKPLKNPQDFGMTSLPPWHFLKSKTKEPVDDNGLTASIAWVRPVPLCLEKNVKFYRDLLKSTEKVELTLSHSGKKETFECDDTPRDPERVSRENLGKHTVVLVQLREDNDPRLPYILANRDVDTRPEYKDTEHLMSILLRRAQMATPAGSKSMTPVGSPRNSAENVNASAKKPPPPPAGSRPPPPPPPKAPPEKRLKQA